MAIINCKECGADISDKAKACPKCGAPNDTISTGKLIELLLYLALIAGGAFYLNHRLGQIAYDTAPKLSAQEQQQMTYYAKICKAKGLTPNTAPFTACIINLRGNQLNSSSR